jgi:hypothetical protein
MANQNGSIYGLTILSPIKSDLMSDGSGGLISADLALRMYLAKLDRGAGSPFAKVSSTHFARLVVMRDVPYFGMPSCEEHLKAQYLIFESNFDGDLDTYLDRMASEIPQMVADVWQHCIGFPGVADRGAFRAYMKKCQVKTTFFFADVNNKTVEQTLRALRTQAAVARFIEKHQGKPPSEIQSAFAKLADTLRNAPQPLPAAVPGKVLTDELI